MAETVSQSKTESKERPTIRQLVNAAALQGVSVRDILLTPREAASQPLLDEWAERTILPLDMGRHDDVVREVARLCMCLGRNRGKVLMPPLGFILKDFGIHRSFFKEFRPDFYTRSIDLFKGQLVGLNRDLYEEIFPIALNTLRNMHQDRSGVMRWRLHCLVAQHAGLSREAVAPACNSALAYHKLAKAAKERIGKADTIRVAQGSASSAYRGGPAAAKPEQTSLF